MTSRRIARRASHTILTAVAAALAVAVPATAATIQPDFRPDLVVAAPLETHTYSDAPGANGYFLDVANTGITAAASNQVKVTFQPVSQLHLNGQTYWVNMPGTTPIVGTGTAPSLAGGGHNTSLSIQLSTPPAGYNRVTACADVTNVVNESNESNNCLTEIVQMQPIFFG
jgi:hypothetical protein